MPLLDRVNGRVNLTGCMDGEYELGGNQTMIPSQVTRSTKGDNCFNQVLMQKSFC